MSSLELIAAIRSGRGVKAAQDRLYSLVRQALLERLGTRIPPRLQARLDAEDVLQTAFLRALDALESFEPKNEHSFIAWVYQIAKNYIADQGKRRSAAAARFTRGTASHGPRLSALPARSRRAESLAQPREWIERLLVRLERQKAEVIRLRDLEELSYEEIAAAWDKTPGAVQRFHSRAWQELCAMAREEERGGGR